MSDTPTDKLFADLVKVLRKGETLRVALRKLHDEQNEIVRQLREHQASEYDIYCVLDDEYEPLEEDTASARQSDENNNEVANKITTGTPETTGDGKATGAKVTGTSGTMMNMEKEPITARSIGEYVEKRLDVFHDIIDELNEREYDLHSKYKKEMGVLETERQEILARCDAECDAGKDQMRRRERGLGLAWNLRGHGEPSPKRQKQTPRTRNRHQPPPPSPPTPPTPPTPTLTPPTPPSRPHPDDLKNLKPSSRFPASSKEWVKRVLKNVTIVAKFANNILDQNKKTIKDDSKLGKNQVTKMFNGWVTCEVETFNKAVVWAGDLHVIYNIPSIEPGVFDNATIPPRSFVFE